jgi:hypothetical protein
MTAAEYEPGAEQKPEVGGLQESTAPAYHVRTFELLVKCGCEVGLLYVWPHCEFDVYDLLYPIFPLKLVERTHVY